MRIDRVSRKRGFGVYAGLVAVLFVLGVCFPVSQGRAETVAVGGGLLLGSGGGLGAFGFSFVPSTNLVVTRVGYVPFGSGNLPFVRFYSGSNVIATYNLNSNEPVGTVAYTNVAPLGLAAGRRYAVILQNGPDVSSSGIGFYGYAGVVPGSEITSYQSVKLESDGTIVDNSAPPESGWNPILLEGPNFYYEVAGPLPELTISRAGANATVSWPSPSTGYRLQQSGVLENPEGWSDFVGSINDDGTNKSVTVSFEAEAVFYRLKM